MQPALTAIPITEESLGKFPPFGSLFRYFREQSGVTMGQLARRLGVGVVDVSAVEQGMAPPFSEQQLARAADLCGLEEGPCVRLELARRRQANPPTRRAVVALETLRLPGDLQRFIHGVEHYGELVVESLQASTQEDAERLYARLDEHLLYLIERLRALTAVAARATLPPSGIEERPSSAGS